MPLLFSLGQHEALEDVHRQLRAGEYIFAFLDDIYLVTPLRRAGPVYAALEEDLRVHARIRIHTGKTKVWNRADVRPDVCDVLERIALATDPTAWQGPTLPTHKQGIKVLGTPLGHPDFVRDQLRQVTDEHQTCCCIAHQPELVTISE